jgi:hypothetical protein
LTYEPPPSTTQLRAGELANAGIPYLFKALDDDDSAWNLVREIPTCRLVPDKDGFLPPVVTVNFADGTVRLFNPDDQVLVGPVIRT